MASRRPVILMGILLAAMLGYAYRVYWYPLHGGGLIQQAPEAPPLPGRNAITGLTVRQIHGSVWKADFDYFYTGEPRWASLKLDLDLHTGTDGQASAELRETFIPPMQRGAHHVSVDINYPGMSGSTRALEVQMRKPPDMAVVARQRIDQSIDWPDWNGWQRDQQLVREPPAANLQRAVELIDEEDARALTEAKAILEQLIGKDPQYDAAYVELARVAMRTNWGPEGLHQAEALLDSALKIRPDSVNAKILLGYVYANQSRYAQAEALFTDAARSNPRNLWLWTNWGELKEAQGKPAEATAKYREAISHPMTHDTYDRARGRAYVHLLRLVQQGGDLDELERLYKRRVQEFGPGSCYSTDYARFLLQVRGDSDGAIDLTRRALNQECEDSPARRVLGMAEYVKWSQGTGPERLEALNQARIFLPAGPMALYMLATSDRTLPAARKLVESGEKIDQLDNEHMTALAHALQDSDAKAARRLLTLGAHADLPVSAQGIPAALIPVMQRNLEVIRALQKAGVDYSKISFQGMSAAAIAHRSGDAELERVLSAKGSLL